MPFAAAIHRHADEHPYAPAFRMEGRVFTFDELKRFAGQLAAAFDDLAGLPGTAACLAPAHA